MGTRIGWLLLGALCMLVPATLSAAPHKAAKAKGRPKASHAAPKSPPARVQQAAPAPAGAELKAAAQEARKAEKPEEDRELKRGERVEFDGRLIEGQTAAAGAIYLFERLPSELRSMVAERKSYRHEVLETIYPNGVAPTAERAGSGR